MTVPTDPSFINWPIMDWPIVEWPPFDFGD